MNDKPIRVLWNRYGVEVYAGEEFLGAIASSDVREVDRLATVLRDILQAAGLTVDAIEEN